MPRVVETWKSVSILSRMVGIEMIGAESSRALRVCRLDVFSTVMAVRYKGVRKRGKIPDLRWSPHSRCVVKEVIAFIFMLWNALRCRLPKAFESG